MVYGAGEPTHARAGRGPVCVRGADGVTAYLQTGKQYIAYFVFFEKRGKRGKIHIYSLTY